MVKLQLPAGRQGTHNLRLPPSLWCPRQELNLHLQLRRLAVYPLAYEGMTEKSYKE